VDDRLVGTRHTTTWRLAGGARAEGWAVCEWQQGARARSRASAASDTPVWLSGAHLRAAVVQVGQAARHVQRELYGAPHGWEAVAWRRPGGKGGGRGGVRAGRGGCQGSRGRRVGWRADAAWGAAASRAAGVLMRCRAVHGCKLAWVQLWVRPLTGAAKGAGARSARGLAAAPRRAGRGQAKVRRGAGTEEPGQALRRPGRARPARGFAAAP
jgi:hypothetical protein